MVDLYNKRVLIAASSANLLRSLNICLQMNGCKTIMANSAVQAMSLAIREDPDLIILDIGLPHGDAYRLMKHLRSVVTSSSIPIVIMREQLHSIRLESDHNTRISGYIRNPADIEELLETVQAIFQNNESQKCTQTVRQEFAA